VFYLSNLWFKNEIKLGLLNYDIIMPIENSSFIFNNNKVNSLQMHDIAKITEFYTK
jgi:hypothetical protein